MIILISLSYIALVVVAFKVIKIKVSPVSIATAALIGVVLLTGIFVAWKMSAPITDQMFLRRRVLSVSPDVREIVSKVHVKGNDQVKKGDPLFDILPDRFEDAVNQASAQLEAAKSTVKQLKADVVAAAASLKQSQADTATSKAELDTALAIQKSNPAAIAKLKVQEAQQGLRADQAEDKVYQAKLKQSKFSLAAAEHSVEVSKAALDTAKFNLERCTYISPIDGQVMNWQVIEGTPVARWQFASVGTVQDFSDSDVIAIFPQNQLKNVKTDNVAEITFKRKPGQIFTGMVVKVVPYTGEGQFMADRTLPVAADVGSKGYLAVRIALDDPDLARELPLGAAGTTTIYTDSGKPWHIISKITVRIKMWMNYLPM